MIAVDLPFTSAAGVFMVLFVVVLVMPRLASAVRLPGLVGLTVGGVVIGPFGLGFLERSGPVALLGGAGLLFLMFEAGLECDRELLRQERRQTAVFGVLTFVAPFTLGVFVHLWLDYSLLAALLLASCWSSHTLLSYPLFQRAGVTDNRSIAVGLGGTIITDTAALLTLVVLARIHEGDLSLTYAVTTGPLLVVAGLAIVWGVPRLASWFFTGIGQERSARFLFVVFVLFGAASLAEFAGVEAIIGAFLAGFALNRQVVVGSPLAGQVAFFGSNLLTPMFMISVGMLIDPALLISDGETLRRAAGFTVAVVVGKALAAWLTGAAFGWRRAEIAALFSLSVAQAAATLAAVFVGVEIGLLGESTVNAVIIVILVTCVLSSLVGDFVTSRLPRPAVRTDRIGKRVLLPIAANDRSQVTGPIAAALAKSDAGTVIPLTVLDPSAAAGSVRFRRDEMVRGVERSLLALGSEARAEVRLDASLGLGVLHAAAEHDATCIVIGWKGWSSARQTYFGASVNALLADSPVPLLIVRPGGDESPSRVVLLIDEIDLRHQHRAGVVLGAAIAARLASAHGIPLEIVTTTALDPIDFGLESTVVQHVVRTSTEQMEAARDRTRPGDLIVKGLPTTGLGLGSRLVRITRSLPGRTVIATAPSRYEDEQRNGDEHGGSLLRGARLHNGSRSDQGGANGV